MATNYTTLKLTDRQVQALFTIIGTTNAGYFDNITVDEELGMTVWRDTHKAINQIEQKLAKAGWE
jgi:hypothetical protein